MKVTLISDDPELYNLLRPILAGLSKSSSMAAVTSGEPVPEADLYLWDFEPGMIIRWDFHGAAQQRHLFLVHRKDLDLLRVHCPAAEGRILLKPLVRATVEAFLEQALKRCERRSSEAGAGPSDCDEMLQSLIQANLRLQEYDQDRTNFLARALHDFAAPLTTLNGYCGLLVEEQLGELSGEQKEVVGRMQSGAKRLSQLTNAMFQLSVGRHLRSKPKLEEGDIQKSIDQAMNDLMAFTEEKRITISVKLAPSPEPLYFEAPQIEQVLLNLLENACKFSPKFGSVEVRGYPFFWERRAAPRAGIERPRERRSMERRSPNSFRVDILDAGPGVPAELLGNLFEEYTSYSGSRDRSGGGLSLAICKMILQRHQGWIWAENGPNGAMFSFVLPFRQMESKSASGKTMLSGMHRSATH